MRKSHGEVEVIGGEIVLAVVAATTAPAAAAPPAETLARLDAATRAVESWPGTYLMTTRATVSRTDGSHPERSVAAMRMAGGKGGPTVVEVISATRDGKDVTAETRADVAKAQAKRAAAHDGGRGDDDSDAALDLPGADSAGKYAFAPVAAAGDDCGAAFAPAREHAGDRGLSRGELHWSCSTLDPSWVTVSPVSNPKGVSELTLRMDLERSGDTLYLARTVTDGVGGVLFIKRRFHVEVEIGELTPAGPAATAAP